MGSKGFVTAGIVAALLLSSCYHPRESQRIGIMNWSEGLVGYQQARQGILDGLRDSGYREGFNIEIDYRNAKGKDAEAKRIIADFVSKKYDLIATVGSAACLVAMEGTKDRRIPVVYSVVSYPKEAGVIDDWQSSGKNVTGVSIEIPAELYFEKLKGAIPGAKNIGIVHTGRYATAIAAARQALLAAPAFGLTPHLIKLSGDEQEKDIKDIVKQLPAKMDAVYIAGDPVLYAEEAMRRIVPAFKKLGIPPILISENYLKYGALLALNGDFYKIGRQTVPHILKVFDGVRPTDIPSEKPYDVRFSINKKTADDLGIHIGWNVLIDADSIVE